MGAARDYGLLLEASEKNPDYGIISPMHLTGSGDTLDRNFEFYLRKDYSPQIIRQWENASDQTLKPSQFVNGGSVAGYPENVSS